jgi:uncharacterized membrane protein YfcA
MENLIVSPYILALLFFIVAFAYSSVGLGGGSSYTALLFIFGVSHTMIPAVSFPLNIAVTSIGSFNFIRFGHARWSLILPFLVTSIPFAFIGSAFPISKTFFQWLLLVSLLIVIARTYLVDRLALKFELVGVKKILVSLVCGAILGYIAGAVGIGGGIYLVPLIIVLGLGNAKHAAAAGAIFVWVNSLTGLLTKYFKDQLSVELILPLLAAVIAGGLLGSWIGARRLSPKQMEKILGIILVVAVVLIIRKL